MKTILATCAATVVLASSASFAAGRPIAAADLLALQRVSDPQLSPDGTRVLYTVATPDLKANRMARDVWMATLASGETTNLTKNGHEGGARWSPDGRTIAFISTRGGSMQLFVMEAGGGEPTQITTLSGGVDNLVWAPDGNAIAFTSEAYPDCKDDACNARRDKEREAEPVRPRIYDHLLYRHWTSWSSGKRSHLFIVSLDAARRRATGEPRDLTAGADYDVPPVQREGPHPIAFAPDSRTLCFVAITDPVEATSTNADLFEIDANGGTPRRLTTNSGFDGAPAYSPDGRRIAYRSQARPGYEADKWRLMILDRTAGRSASLTDAFDRSVDTPLWSSDGTSIYFNAEDRGEMPLFVIPAAGGTPKPITPGSYDAEFTLAAHDSLVVARSSLKAPTDLFVVSNNGQTRALTHQNAAALASLELPAGESFTFKSRDGADVQGFLVRPPAFDASKKYPVVMLLHGGPQTQWSDTWSYRWNAQAFAAPGYAIVMINRRGSTGFGQKFTDEITNDWGGKAFDDVMAGLEFVLGKYTFADRQRVVAAGASYGGYMIDWLASQSKGRFRALVSHAGVYDLTSMYGATEELWFPEHDFAGTPWTNPTSYQKWSPSSYAADFGKYKTPTLVIAGEQDFRVPYTQSLEFYTALQRQSVPSKLIVFPDEGHWILKPQNSAVWYGEVLDWLARYLTADQAPQKSAR
jgi:dipeptidyl aminopeptidase/acylaminoacyl peptidase